MVINVLDTDFNSLDEMVRYYSKLYRERALEFDAPFYDFSPNGRFKVHFERLWKLFQEYPEINPMEYIKVAFVSEDTGSWLPHRLLGKIHMRRYLTYKSDNITKLDDTEANNVVETELQDFISQVTTVYRKNHRKEDRINPMPIARKYIELMNDRNHPEVALNNIRMSRMINNFPPNSILVLSSKYRKMLESVGNEYQDMKDELKKLSHLRNIAIRKTELIKKLNSIDRWATKLDFFG